MNQDIKKLERELKLIKEEFSIKISSIEKKISFLKSKLSINDETEHLEERIQEIQKAPEYKVSAKETAAPAKTTLPKKPGILKTVVLSLLAGAGGIILLGPMAALTEKVKSLYIHYKNEGKLPILFLTIAGLITLIAGVGYILQYSFVNILSETAKVIAGSTVAIGTVILGIKIINKDKSFGEFGSSIVALGVIINYLTIYFASTSFELVPPVVGFILICINTVAAYILALKYETRIVAIISFMGGAFTPFFLKSSGQPPIYYFSFLLILCLSTIYLARKIKWTTLVYISFFISAGIIESTFFFRDLSSDKYIFTILLTIFSYIYFYFSLFDGFNIKRTLEKNDIYIITGSGSLLLINLYLLLGSSPELGYLYFANALIFLIPAFMSIVEKRDNIRMIFFLVSGVFIALAIPAIFSFKNMPLFWAAEAILLILPGFIYTINEVRREGYLVLLVSFVMTISSSHIIFHNWSKELFNMGTINLIGFGLFLIVINFIFSKYSHLITSLEKRVSFVINEILSAWALSVFMIVTFFYFQDYGLIFAIIPIPFLLFWANKKGLVLTVVLAISCYIMILAQAVISITEVGSTLFTRQVVTGKIAFIEAFLLLWFMQLLYEKFMPESTLAKFMRKVRIAFYLYLPFVFLPYINEYHNSFIPIAIWGSVIINLVLFKIIKEKILLNELKILILLSTVVTFLFSESINNNLFVAPEFYSPFIGLTLFSILFFFTKGLKLGNQDNSEFKFFHRYYFIYIGIFIFILLQNLFFIGDKFSILGIVIYILTILLFNKKLLPVVPLKNLYFRFSQLLIFGTIAAIIVDNRINLGNLTLIITTSILLFILIYKNSLFYLKENISENILSDKSYLYDIYFFHMFIASIYLILIYFITNSWSGPFTTIAISIHSIFILFYSTLKEFKRLMPLYIAGFFTAGVKIFFHDLAGFSLLQKIIAFTIIGVIFLISAYGMQKFLSGTIKDNEKQDDKKEI